MWFLIVYGHENSRISGRINSGSTYFSIVLNTRAIVIPELREVDLLQKKRVKASFTVTNFMGTISSFPG